MTAKIVGDSKEREEKCNEKEYFQIIAILLGALAGLTCGMLVAWPSPYLVKIVEDKANYNITEEQASLFTVLNLIGLVVGPPLFIPLVNKIGSKKSLLLTSVPYLLTWLIKYFVTDLYGLYVARLLVGFGDALLMPCLPVYIAEIATPKVRGLWGNAFICSIFGGQFLINVLGAYLSIKATALIGSILPILVLIFFPFMPESPYFCISQGRTEDAKTNLRRLRRVQDVEEEFQTMEMAVNRQLSESGTWKDLFVLKANRRAITVGLFLRTSLPFAGVLTVAAYTQFIFQKSGSNIDSKMSAIIYTAVSAISHTLASVISNKLGRRKSFILSLVSSAVVSLLEGIYFLIDTYYTEIDLAPLQWFPLAGLLCYIVCCSFGISIIPALMIGELFSVSVKTKGVAIVTSLFGLGAIIINNVFYYLNDYTGLSGPFFLFATYSIIAVVITIFIVPETKGKTLEEIQQDLRRESKKCSS